MKERPILFSAPMVRAILSGAKTQTRRVWKMPRGCSWYAEMGGERDGWFVDEGAPWWLHVSECRCPYGQPGDRLWVREAFMHEAADYCWEASVSIPCRPAVTVYRAVHDEHESRCAGWKPSIHMPRALSRITLEITDVRVERLQDISVRDSIAEGIPAGGPENPDGIELRDFRALWESINGPGSWDANPWLWVVSFRKLEAA